MSMFWTKLRIKGLDKRFHCSLGYLIMMALNDFEKRLIKLETTHKNECQNSEVKNG